jgi:TetR/AcrR family transcriptional regulator, regulator of autoinduction and epiphytic fitness
MVALAAPVPAETDRVRDGRVLRRQQSYERAVDALLDLLVSGNPAPTAQEIAARSGISVRTVFRLTEDIESLHAAAVTRQMERTAHLYEPLPTEGTVAERIRRLVAARRAVFEAIAPVRRVGDRLAAGSPRIADGLALHHRILRAQVAQLFAGELASLPAAQRTVALDAADVAAGWETWDQLRRSKRSASGAAKVVTALLDGLFRETPPARVKPV